MSELRIIVHYPLRAGEMLLRTDSDWELDVRPHSIEGHRYEFLLKTEKPFLYFKPLIRRGDEVTWAQGENLLAINTDGTAMEPMASGRPAPAAGEFYPHFTPERHCSACEIAELDGHRFRVFHPPGYDENLLQRYPVLYMHDGQNLFFPEEAFGGNDWKISETMSTLDAMNLIEKVIVVGIYSRDRMVEYTRDGYHEYGSFIVEKLKPYIDRHYRTLTGPQHTAVMGSSLGGVVSFYLGWQWPEIFGNAACMSSTFTYNDDLMQRVATEAKRDVRFYLDSGWPEDNYEVTRSMRDLLARRGYQFGRDLLHFAFPNEHHNEKAWGTRSHVPFQFFFGQRRVDL